MKKSVSFALILCLVFALCLPAFAEENKESGETAEMMIPFKTEPCEYSAELFKPDVYEGIWGTVSDLLNFYIPEDWIDDEELRDEDENVNVFCALCSPDKKTHVTFTLYSKEKVGELGLNEASPVVDIAGVFQLMGCEDVELATVNGIGCFSYSDPENDSKNFVIKLNDGSLVNIAFYPWSDPECADTLWNILCSMSLPQE